MSPKVWKAVALTGVALTTIGASVGYIDIATDFRFEALSAHFEFLTLCLLVGAVIAFVGLIGWGRHLERPSRVHMAGWVFAFPWILCLLGYPIAGFNVHGPAPLVLLLIIPASILAIVLLLVRNSNSVSTD